MKSSLENAPGAVHPLLASLAVPLAKGDNRGSPGTRFSSATAPERGMKGLKFPLPKGGEKANDSGCEAFRGLS